MEEKKISIGQLAELTGVSRRAIRFYVQTGLLPAPSGAGRGHFYTEEHLQILQQILLQKENRHSLDEIAALLHAQPDQSFHLIQDLPVPTTWTRIEVCPGVEIQVQGGMYPVTPARIKKLQKFVHQLFGATVPNDKGEAK